MTARGKLVELPRLLTVWNAFATHADSSPHTQALSAHCDLDTSVWMCRLLICSLHIFDVLAQGFRFLHALCRTNHFFLGGSFRRLQDT